MCEGGTLQLLVIVVCCMCEDRERSSERWVKRSQMGGLALISSLQSMSWPLLQRPQRHSLPPCIHLSLSLQAPKEHSDYGLYNTNDSGETNYVLSCLHGCRSSSRNSVYPNLVPSLHNLLGLHISHDASDQSYALSNDSVPPLAVSETRLFPCKIRCSEAAVLHSLTDFTSTFDTRHHSFYLLHNLLFRPSHNH